MQSPASGKATEIDCSTDTHQGGNLTVSRIKAINAYRPRIVLGKRAGTDDLVDFIARATALNESGVRQMLLELRDAVVFFNLRGQPVKLEGLGTYTPTIGLDGKFGVGHRADTQIKNQLNVSGKFGGNIENRDSAFSLHSKDSKTGDELVTRWNEEHPDDLVE